MHTYTRVCMCVCVCGCTLSTCVIITYTAYIVKKDRSYVRVFRLVFSW